MLKFQQSKKFLKIFHEEKKTMGIDYIICYN